MLVSIVAKFELHSRSILAVSCWFFAQLIQMISNYCLNQLKVVMVYYFLLTSDICVFLFKLLEFTETLWDSLFIGGLHGNNFVTKTKHTVCRPIVNEHTFLTVFEIFYEYLQIWKCWCTSLSFYFNHLMCFVIVIKWHSFTWETYVLHICLTANDDSTCHTSKEVHSHAWWICVVVDVFFVADDMI